MMRFLTVSSFLANHCQNFDSLNDVQAFLLRVFYSLKSIESMMSKMNLKYRSGSTTAYRPVLSNMACSSVLFFQLDFFNVKTFFFKDAHFTSVL